MRTYEFKRLFLRAIQEYFPEARVEIQERRDTVLKARIEIDEETFIDIYFNALTGKKSYALISRADRVMGYDNYRFWHYHPPDRPGDHIPCEEPEIRGVLKEMKETIIG